MSNASVLSVTWKGMVFHIPPSLNDGLRRYFEHRIATGSFLRAVLEDRLSDALAHASIESLECLPGLVSYIRNNDDFPASAYGSPEKVKAWLEGGGTC